MGKSKSKKRATRPLRPSSSLSKIRKPNPNIKSTSTNKNPNSSSKFISTSASKGDSSLSLKRSILASSATKKQNHNTNSKQTQHQNATIPFFRHERILLVGEGDLSFARSLREYHGCENLTATVWEGSREELVRKFTGAEGNLRVLEQKVLVRNGRAVEGGEERDEEEDDGSTDQEEDNEEDYDESEIGQRPKSKPEGGGGVKVIFGVDATKLTWPQKSKSERWDRIIFNFPHVGGKSTDVNRQVRYNQELLVSFFTAAIPLLSPKTPSQPPPNIIVTLFTAPPYTLWNIKDLARHSGLAVERSFRFQAEAYPGYRHVRTLGTLKGRKERGEEGKDGGEGEDGGEDEGEEEGKERGWRAEDRASRTYVFVRRGEEKGQPGAGQGRKRGRDGSDDDD